MEAAEDGVVDAKDRLGEAIVGGVEAGAVGVSLRVGVVRLLAVLRGEMLRDRTLLVAHRLQARDALLLQVLDRLLSDRRARVGGVLRREQLVTRELPLEVSRAVLAVGAEAFVLGEHVVVPLFEEWLLATDLCVDVERRVQEDAAIGGGFDHDLLGEIESALLANGPERERREVV